MGTARKKGLFFFRARKRQTPVIINNDNKASKSFPPYKESAIICLVFFGLHSF
jgi:hypothetical protein